MEAKFSFGENVAVWIVLMRKLFVNSKKWSKVKERKMWKSDNLYHDALMHLGLFQKKVVEVELESIQR